MEAGGLVPDDLVIGLVKERVARPDAQRGVLFDGFPRTLAQASALDEALGSRGIDAVVYYVVDDEEIVKRALGRGRSDDTEPVVRKRLEVYRAQTEPLVAAYRARGLLCEVDATGSIDDVERRTRAALDLGAKTGPAGFGAGTGGRR
jgi:adenylate kinase